jgi:regulator of replication initiation timing
MIEVYENIKLTQKVKELKQQIGELQNEIEKLKTHTHRLGYIDNNDWDSSEPNYSVRISKKEVIQCKN